jgi:hypothetical protein
VTPNTSSLTPSPSRARRGDPPSYSTEEASKIIKWWIEGQSVWRGVWIVTDRTHDTASVSRERLCIWMLRRE